MGDEVGGWTWVVIRFEGYVIDLGNDFKSNRKLIERF